MATTLKRGDGSNASFLFFEDRKRTIKEAREENKNLLNGHSISEEEYA
jgi:hypothetical protein